MKRTTILAVFGVMAGFVVAAGIGDVLTPAVGDDRVTARAEPTTRLYVRTVPPGAAVKIDGKQSGTSDQLFQMPADVKRVLVEVELDGRDKKKEVIIRGGQITRVEFDLRPSGSFKKAPPQRNWGPEQATGAPNTMQAGDKTTAWASLTADGQQEWLLLDYAKPVRAKEIHVYESFNPGALSKITAFDANGKEVVLWQLPFAGITVDTTKGYPGIEHTVTRSRGAVRVQMFPVKVDFPIQRVKLYLDSPRVKGWNEIDAVGLVQEGKNIGKTHWATKAEASSTFTTSGSTVYIPRKLTEPSQPLIRVPKGTVTLGDVADTSTGKRSLAGAGHAVEFQRTTHEQKHLFAVQIYASRYGNPQPPKETFHVYLLDRKMRVIKDFEYPYAAIKRTGQMQWYTLKVPPTEVPELFHVALSFNPNRTKGIYLGADKVVARSRSYIGLPGKGFTKGFTPVREGYDWMVRALLTADPDSAKDLPGGVSAVSSDAKPPAVPTAQLPRKPTELAKDDGKPAGKKSFPRGHAVGFETPDGTWNLTSVRIHGARYGQRQPPPEDFHVWLCDKEFKKIAEFPFPYAQFQYGRFGWVTLKTAPTKVPAEFVICVGFGATATKGVFVSHDAQGRSLVGLADKPAGNFTGGNWLIRATVDQVKAP